MPVGQDAARQRAVHRFLVMAIVEWLHAHSVRRWQIRLQLWSLSENMGICKNVREMLALPTRSSTTAFRLSRCCLVTPCTGAGPISVV